MRVYGIIAAGGSGRRMGGGIPKQLLKLNGVTIFERSLKPFIQCPDIEGVVIVAAENIIEHINTTIRNIPAGGKILKVVTGGFARQDSVRNGLKAVPEDIDVVVIHDAVRPFITSSLIAECANSALINGAVTVMKPIKETVKVIENNVVLQTLDRSKLWITQTPQAFRMELIIEAHHFARKENYTGTDDCMLVEHLGHPVYIIEGSDMNIKITTPADLKIAGVILSTFEKTED
ncbi:MAG TPA: 2-C-methyl-D-erythritol 4-phosphate cytidylyltransferase [bacterium]|nr:2-C-methyl-D-erythritol 4-phosphate cytidylyltransferase [bacterium]